MATGIPGECELSPIEVYLAHTFGKGGKVSPGWTEFAILDCYQEFRDVEMIATHLKVPIDQIKEMVEDEEKWIARLDHLFSMYARACARKSHIYNIRRSMDEYNRSPEKSARTAQLLSVMSFVVKGVPPQEDEDTSDEDAKYEELIERQREAMQDG